MGIVALLAAIVIPKYGEMLEKANLGATVGNLACIRSAIAIYYGSYGDFPDTIDPLEQSNFAKILGSDTLPYVKTHYPYNYPPYGNKLTVGNNDTPTEKGSGWYYNKQYVYINSIAKDINGEPYTKH